MIDDEVIEETEDVTEDETPDTDNEQENTENEGGDDDGILDEAVDDSEEKSETEKKVTLKINGKEVEYKESDVIALAQKSAAADERFREAAKAEEKLVQAYEYAKKDPITFLDTLGINFEKIAEDYFIEKFQEENLPEEQKILNKERKEKEEYKKKLEEYEQQQQAKTQEEEYQKYTELHTKRIQNIIESHELPKNDFVVKQYATYQIAAINKGIELDDETIAELIKKDIEEIAAAVAPKQAKGSRATPDNQKASESSKRAKKVMARDFFAELDKKFE